MTWGSYWVQWVVQNVLPPSFWTLAAIGLHYARTRRQHLRTRAQDARHHAERTAQAERHAEELKRQLTVHCSDLKSHVTATGSHVITSAVAVPQELLDGIRKTPKGKPGGDRT